MSRKRIALLVLFFFVVLALGLGAWRFSRIVTMGQEDQSGPQDPIPKVQGEVPPLTRGAADWPRWRGAKGNGKSSQQGIRKDWSGGLEKLWEVSYLCQGAAASTWAAPVVQGERLVVPGRSQGEDLVFCLDAATGKLLWLGSYEAEANAAYGPGARATPCIDGDRVITFGRSGDLACWRLLDGDLLWRKNVREAGGEEPQWGFSSSPLVAGDSVYVQAGGQALAIAYRKASGELAWKSGAGKVGYAAPCLVEVGGAQQLLVFHGEGLTAFALSGGPSLWTIPWKTKYGVNATTPVAFGETVFITSGYKQGSAALRVSASAPPKVLWESKTFAAQHSDPVILDGFIYGYSGNSTQNRGELKCVELETGQEKWSTKEAGWGTLVYADDHLICQDIKGNLFLVRPDPEGFRKVAEHRGAVPGVRQNAWTVPVVANGRLYLRYRQRLICYALVKG